MKNTGKYARACELEEVRDRYRRLVEGLKTEYFFYQHGRDGVFTYVSPSVRDVLGYAPATFLKHYTRYLTDDPVNREVRRYTEKSLRGLRQPPYMLQIFHKNGSRRWLEVLEVPVKDGRGRVTCVEGIAHDVTGRITAQEELEKYRAGLEKLVEEQTAELNAVFERTPVLLLLLDERLRVVRTNAAARDGRLMGEVLNCVNAKGGECGSGKACGGCLIRRAVNGTLRSGKPVSREEGCVETGAGRRAYFLLSAEMIKASTGKQLLLCLDDITRQKETEKSLREAEEMKAFLTQTIVHDLKTPIASILLAGQMLGEQLRSALSEEQRDTLCILNGQAREMGRMVSNMLDISRIEEGKLPLNAEPFRPEELLAEVAESLRITAAHDKKNIVIKARTAPEYVTGDRDLLRRVTENLMANALKFSPEGGRVEAGARRSASGCTEFYVKDSGPGIPARQHARIFEKFVQLDDPAAKKLGGKGMGLAFCKLAVEAHGGGIRVESAPGAGSTFAFSIPPGLPGKKKLV